VKPTSTATKPAVAQDSERSWKKRRMGAVSRLVAKRPLGLAANRDSVTCWSFLAGGTQRFPPDMADRHLTSIR
jgi:hypothetical protein